MTDVHSATCFMTLFKPFFEQCCKEFEEAIKRRQVDQYSLPPRILHNVDDETGKVTIDMLVYVPKTHIRNREAWKRLDELITAITYSAAKLGAPPKTQLVNDDGTPSDDTISPKERMQNLINKQKDKQNENKPKKD